MSARDRPEAGVPLAARVVEVIADRGPSAAERYRYGSGCIVRGRLVLTAAHVVAGAQSVTVRDTAKRGYTAIVDPRFVAAGPDLALIQIGDPDFGLNLPPIGLARVDRDSRSGDPVERCHAVGYPWFAESPSPAAVRDTVDAIGVVPVLSKLAGGLLSVQVSISPRTLPPGKVPLGESEWSGMSGAPVLADGMLLGVVVEHAPREGQSAITAVPLTALERNQASRAGNPGVGDPAAWWSCLGVSGPEELRLLPGRPERPAPAYWDKMRDFGWTLHQRMPQLLGRQREIEDIAAFATGSAGYRWLVGGIFAGKTALLHEAVTVGLPPEVDVVCYFLSRRVSDADTSGFLSAVVPQLAFLCDREPPAVDRDREFPRLWHEAAERAAAAGRHLLLVVDGLDEDVRLAGLPSVASLLPPLAGGHAHVLVASRPHPELPVDVDDAHPLRGTVPVDLEPFAGAPELISLARREIHELTHGPDPALAIDVLGLVTAAAGPVSVTDLTSLLSPELAPRTWQVRRFVEERAARSLEPVGPAEPLRYQFAHSSLLEYARADEDLGCPEFARRIRAWAARWAAAGWRPVPAEGEDPPRYLFDVYPATLSSNPALLTALVGDVGWVDAAIRSTGVDTVLGHLGTARSAASGDAGVLAVLAAVRGQAVNLRPPRLADEPGYVLRQLCLQAAELGDGQLVARARMLLGVLAAPGPVPTWTTRRVSRALSAELAGHSGGTRALAVLPDGRAVTGGMDGTIRIWGISAGPAEAAELGRHDGTVTAVAVLPDGRVISSATDGRVLVWDPAAPLMPPSRLDGRYDVVLAIAAAADGRVVTGGRDGRVLMWDAAAPGMSPVELGRHGGAVHAVAWLPGGRVVSGGRDRGVRVWDPATPRSGPGELGRHGGAVQAVVVLPGGRVVTGGDDGRVLAWDPARGQSAPTEIGRQFSAVHAVAVTPGGRVVCGGRDRRVRIWDPAVPGSAAVELGQHDGMVTAVAVTRDGLAVSCGAEGRIRVWDPAAPGPVGPGRHDQRITALVFAAGGQLVSGGRDGRVLVWEPAGARAARAEFSRRAIAVRAVAALPDGRVACGFQDGLVLIWDPAAPRAGAAELGRHGGAALAALSDGRLISGGYDGRVLVWNPGRISAGPTELGRHHGAVTALAVLTGTRMVSAAAEGPMLLWDLVDGTGPARFGEHPGHKVTSMTVLPGEEVVTGGTDGQVLRWNPAAPGSGPRRSGRHHGWVTSVAAVSGGRIVSSGTDGLVRIWDPGGQATTTCQVQVLAADAGRLLALAHRGGGMSVWNIGSQAPDSRTADISSR